MKKLFIATIITFSAAANADLSSIMKLQAGIAFGKQAMDAAKPLQLAQSDSQRTETKARVVPAQGSPEQACVNALNTELGAIRNTYNTEADLKKDESRLEILKIAKQITPSYDGAIQDLPKSIERTSQRLDKEIAEISRLKLARERICAGLIN